MRQRPGWAPRRAGVCRGQRKPIFFPWEEIWWEKSSVKKRLDLFWGLGQRQQEGRPEDGDREEVREQQKGDQGVTCREGVGTPGRWIFQRSANRIICFYEVQKYTGQSPMMIHVLCWNLMCCQELL